MMIKNDSLEHVGVMGMHWGQRKAEDSGSGSGGRSGLQKVGDRYKRAVTGKSDTGEQLGLIPRLMGRKTNFRLGKKKGQTDAEFDAELEAETKQFHDEALAAKQAKADKKALQDKNQVGIVARLMGRTENFRLGKQPGQTNAEFDAEMETERKQIEAQVGEERRADAAKQAQKAIANAAKYDKEIKERKTYAMTEIEYEVDYEKNKKNNKNYNEAEHRAKLQKIYAADLNATPQSIHKERVETGVQLAGAALLIVGTVVAQNVMKNHLDKLANARYEKLIGNALKVAKAVKG
jgi:hypothetical protein